MSTERHHCERCGYELDNGNDCGPIGDYSFLCHVCGRDLMQQDPKRYPLMQPVPVADWECKTCGWHGNGLHISVVPTQHHQWNSGKGYNCPGNVARVVAVWKDRTDYGDTNAERMRE